MADLFRRLSHRRSHLEAQNLLRSLTEVINKVPDGINLGQGVCDLDAPLPLQQGAVDSIRGLTDRQTYTFYCGVPELREQIAKKLRDFNGLDFGADQVLVTAGSSAAFFAAGQTLFDPGDEVILFEPFYSYHYTALKLMGARPVSVPLAEKDFAFDPERLRAALSSKTRAIVVNTPANPSGKIFSQQDLAGLAQVIADSEILLLTDEVYEYMCYDGRRHVSPGAVPGLEDRTLTIGGLSKTYSVTGWRIGYLAGPAPVVDAIGRVFDQIDICAARPMQRGVERALAELPESYYADLGFDYERRRDLICAALEEGGFGVRRPEGAYYVLADYRGVLGDLHPEEAAMRLIRRFGINAVPGHLFYEDQEGVRCLRFHFAVNDEVLEEVCRRLRA